ncbi:MAG: YaiI/YqxD family protein [Gammaproteobacteria bacterium]|nr:YaiI/YqxD family protein [Gammaproteobacteria bacterium]MDH3858227.1 YaiI/YqxD family protein [Gammaproteobacteria bacterium]
MKIWVDADACPNPIKEILFRAAERTGITLTLIANHEIRIKPSRHISFLRVKSGFDVADNEIVKRLTAGDLVITSDIPLAAEIIAHQGQALSPRGELFTSDNIKARLTMRDLMESLRACGVESGGQAPLNHGDRKAFADQLDKIITHQD